jgi:hypothetical protein
MSSAVKLSDSMVSDARVQARAFHRSVAEQIEHWAHIGKILEENQDYTYAFIKNLLVSVKEANAGLIEPYHFN